MARYIKAVECAEIISKKLNIPLGDLVDIFAEIPTADVVPKSEVAREIFEEIEKCWIDSDTLPDCARLVDLDKIAELKKKYTEDKV